MLFSYPFTTHITTDWAGEEWSGVACLASCIVSEWGADAPEIVTKSTARAHNVQRSTQSPAELLNVAAQEGFLGEQWDEWGECEQGLRTGRAVLALISNRFPIPRHYPEGILDDGLHWVRILGLWSTAQLAIVHDPCAFHAQPNGFVYQGPVLYTAWSVRWGAIANRDPAMGVILQSPSGKNLNNG